MATYGELQDRIADELDRDDLASQIRNAIQDAISYYEPCRFWFLEGTETGTTATASAAYAISAGVIDIKRVSVTLPGYDYSLTKRTFDWYRDRTVNASILSGQPTDYAIFGEDLYMYPTPDQTYSYTIYCTASETTLSASTDANAWTDQGERMIRMRAMSFIHSDVIKDKKGAEYYAALAEREKTVLEKRHVGRVATERLTPTDF